MWDWDLEERGGDINVAWHFICMAASGCMCCKVGRRLMVLNMSSSHACVGRLDDFQFFCMMYRGIYCGLVGNFGDF